MRSIILGVALVGCSISSPGGVAGDDNTAIKDPPRGEVGPLAPISPPGSGSGATTATSRVIQCPGSLRIERHPDGSYREDQISIALIPGIDPRSNYMIEQCEHIVGEKVGYADIEGMYDCQPGDTCTPVPGFAPYPITNEHTLCSWSKGQFWGDNLVIQCGHTWADRAADGTLLANHSDQWGATILHTW